MTTKSDTGYSDGLVNRADVQRALATVQDLRDGISVSPTALAESQETLLQMLWQDSSASAVHAPLIIILENSSDAASQGELLGELIATGKRTAPILDRLSLRSMKFHLADDESSALRDALSHSIRDRLALLGKMLQDSKRDRQQQDQPRSDGGRELSPNDREPADDESPGPSGGGAKQSALHETETSRQRIAKVDPRRPDPGGPDPDAGQGGPGKAEFDAASADQLLDRSIPEGTRIDLATDIGSPAVPILAKLLGGEDNEFATLALVHLGQQAKSRHSVYTTALRLESMEGIKSARLIRETIDNPGNSEKNDLRSRAKDSAIGDTYLMRALSNCDAPSIMRASLGREAYAIPLAMRTLASLRKL